MDISEDLPMAEAVMCFSHIGTRTGKVTAQECYYDIIHEWRKYFFMGLEDTIRRMLYDGCKVDDEVEEVAERIEDLVVRQLTDMFKKIADDVVDKDCFNTAITDVINWMSIKQQLRQSSDDVRESILSDMEFWIYEDDDDPEKEYLTIPDDYRWIFLENLTSIELPEYMQCIPGEFFSGFSGIESMTIREGVRIINDNAFFQCINLRTVVLPKTIRRLDSGAFRCCEMLQHITMPENDVYICEGECVMKKDDHSVVCGCANSQIPESAIAISDAAFTGNSALTSITFPNGLESIGAFAFASCEGLQEIIIPKSVKNIDGLAFNHCTGLQRIVFEGGPTVMYSAFAECVNVKTIKGLSNEIITAYPSAFDLTKDRAVFELPVEIHWIEDELPLYNLCDEP